MQSEEEKKWRSPAKEGSVMEEDYMYWNNICGHSVGD